MLAVTVSGVGNVTAGTRMKFHLRSLVLSAGLTPACGISDVWCHVVGKKEKERGGKIEKKKVTHGLSSSNTMGLSSFRGR